MPDVPTTVEAGLPDDCGLSVLHGAVCAGEDAARDHRSAARETTLALQAPAVQERFAKLGVEPLPMTLEQFDKFFREDVAATAALVKAANIPMQ